MSRVHLRRGTHLPRAEEKSERRLPSIWLLLAAAIVVGVWISPDVVDPLRGLTR